MEEDTKERLKSLFEDYHRKVPDKIHEIETLWQPLLKQWTRDDLVKLHLKVHSLNGSAAIYGKPELSEAAKEIDLTLKEYLNGETPNKEKIESIDKMIAGLRRFLEG